MADKTDVWLGILSLMILSTLETMARETRDWEQTTAILARFLSPAQEA